MSLLMVIYGLFIEDGLFTIVTRYCPKRYELVFSLFFKEKHSRNNSIKYINRYKSVIYLLNNIIVRLLLQGCFQRYIKLYFDKIKIEFCDNYI